MKSLTKKTKTSTFNAFEKVAISKTKQGQLKGGDGDVIPLPSNVIIDEVVEG